MGDFDALRAEFEAEANHRFQIGEVLPVDDEIRC